MTELGLVLVGLPVGLLLYTYVGYPAVLALLGAFRRPSPVADPTEWPSVSVSLPAYNEADAIGDTIRAWLAVDYPEDKCDR
jgi:cellulose synthase/poly-beta-1,6-N-acetylglucosamine synthase-like glycosyltransferase